MYSSENQRECEGSGTRTQYSYSTSLAGNQGLTLTICCIQTRGLSRAIKIVTHNIDNVDASFKYDVFVHVGICYRTVLSMHY